jgi:hypothetical protein
MIFGDELARHHGIPTTRQLIRESTARFESSLGATRKYALNPYMQHDQMIRQVAALELDWLVLKRLIEREEV